MGRLSLKDSAGRKNFERAVKEVMLDHIGVQTFRFGLSFSSGEGSDVRACWSPNL